MSKGLPKNGVIKLRNDPMEAVKQLTAMAIGILAVAGGITAAIFATDGEFGAAPDGPMSAAESGDEEPDQNETDLPELPEGAPEAPDLPAVPVDTGI